MVKTLNVFPFYYASSVKYFPLEIAGSLKWFIRYCMQIYTYKQFWCPSLPIIWLSGSDCRLVHVSLIQVEELWSFEMKNLFLTSSNPAQKYCLLAVWLVEPSGFSWRPCFQKRGSSWASQGTCFAWPSWVTAKPRHSLWVLCFSQEISAFDSSDISLLPPTPFPSVCDLVLSEQILRMSRSSGIILCIVTLPTSGCSVNFFIDV